MFFSELYFNQIVAVEAVNDGLHALCVHPREMILLQSNKALITLSLFDFYGNGEAANKWFGMKVYIVVDTSMLFVLSFDVFKKHRRKAHLTDLRFQFQKLFEKFECPTFIIRNVGYYWIPLSCRNFSANFRKTNGYFMHAPYRKYL